MEMNDNTILRIKVPAHLYEAVKAQLTINEAKGKKNLGAGMELVKEKKSSSGDKSKAHKKAATPKEEAKVPHDGMKKVEKKKLGLEELKAIVELLNGEIAQLEEKKEEKAPMEEKKEEGHEEKEKE